MVEIRRRRVLGGADDDDSSKGGPDRRRSRVHASPDSSSVKSCLQFLVMSSLVPALFFLRFARDDLDTFLRYKLTLPTTPLPEPFTFLPDLLREYNEEIRLSSHSEMDHEWLDSDIAELHHCRSILTSPTMGWTNFTTWAAPLVNQTRHQLILEGNAALSDAQQDTMQQEIILELLELYAMHYGYCNFYRYRPTLVQKSDAFEGTSKLDVPENHARCAFVITVRRNDPVHLQRLVKAIHMPHHFIVLHLDQQSNTALQTELMEMAKAYDNVEVVIFGTVHGQREDSMSNIHLKIMRWLSIELGLEFDYHITLDGASFPLRNAKDMAQHLFAASQSVWLGTLTEKGHLMSKSQKNRLYNTLLTTTSTPATARLGRIFEETTFLPGFSANILNHKTTSGNYAIFSQSLIRKLLSSPEALELFAMSKYACCSTSFDSYNWMAALELLNGNNNNNSYGGLNSISSGPLELISIPNQAKLYTSMFQLWGGTGDCEDARLADSQVLDNSATLRMDPSLCYRIEHGQVVKAVHGEQFNNTKFIESDWEIAKDHLLVRGADGLLKHLKGAVKAGFLFARQFDSKDPKSVALLDAIEGEWATPT